METEQITAYKNLASQVIALAVQDIVEGNRWIRRWEQNLNESPPLTRAQKKHAKAQQIRMEQVRNDIEHPRHFLTHPDTAKDRALWLAWLGMNEDGFQQLLHQHKFQGQTNKVQNDLLLATRFPLGR